MGNTTCNFQCRDKVILQYCKKIIFMIYCLRNFFKGLP